MLSEVMEGRGGGTRLKGGGKSGFAFWHLFEIGGG